ncbi:MAG: hypothetical protein ACI4PF_03620 [Christensenellales bacterium]
MAETKKTTKTTSSTTKPASSKSTTTTKTTKSSTTKKPETKSTTQSSSNNSSTSSKKSRHHSGGIMTWGINKISFYSIGAVAILYLIASVLALCGLNLKVVSALQGLATAVIISIVAFLAWKYVRSKQTVWKVLYFVLLLVVLLGVILPLVV